MKWTMFLCGANTVSSIFNFLFFIDGSKLPHFILFLTNAIVAGILAWRGIKNG